MATLALGVGVVSADDVERPSLEDCIARLTGPDDDARAAAIADIVTYEAEAVPALGAALDHVSAPVRLAAVEALALIGTHAEPALPKLIELAGFAIEDVRIAAATAIGAIGSEAGIEALVALLDDENEDIGDAAAGALMALGRRHASVFQVLIDLIVEGRRDIGFARLALARSGQAAVPAICKALEKAKGDALLRLLDVLILMGPEARGAARTLVTLSRSDDAELASAVREVLGVVFQNLSGTIAAIIGELQTGSDEARAMAAQTLGVVRPHKPEALAALVDALADDSEMVRAAVASAIGTLGIHAASAAPELCELMTTDKPAVAREAADALGSIGQEDPAVSRHLIPLLADEATVGQLAERALRGMGEGIRPILSEALAESEAESRTRRRLLGVLDQLGQDADVDVDALLEQLESKDLEIRNAASRALERAGSGAVRGLVFKLTRDDESIRRIAAETLGAIGPEARMAVPDLTQALRDKDALVRKHAAGALGLIGVADDEVNSALIKRLKDRDEFVRRSVASSLGRLGASDKRVPGALAKSLKDKEVKVRMAVAEALGTLGPAASGAVDALAKAIKSDNELEVQWRVARSLGQIGVASKRVLAALQGGLISDNVHVRCASVTALGELGTAASRLIDNVERLADDPSSDVRNAVGAALPKLRGE